MLSLGLMISIKLRVAGRIAGGVMHGSNGYSTTPGKHSTIRRNRCDPSRPNRRARRQKTRSEHLTDRFFSRIGLSREALLKKAALPLALSSSLIVPPPLDGA